MKNFPIGIDIKSDGIRALQMASDRQGLRIRSAVHLPLAEHLSGSEQDLDALVPVLRDLAGQRAFKGRQAVVALPGDYLHVFPVTLELTGQHVFESALAQSCSRHLAFPLEQAVIDYFCIEELPAETGRKLRVTVVALRRDLVHKVIRVFKQARLSVGIIDYGLCALIRLHDRIHSLTSDPLVLVHMEEKSIYLAVANRTNVIAHRQLDWGWDRLTEQVEEMLGLEAEPQQARAMLSDYGVDYDALQPSDGLSENQPVQHRPDEIAAMRTMSQILAPIMESLVQELFQIIGYARSVAPQIRFQELWLYGLANDIKNLGPFLEKRLGFPAHGMDPSEKLVSPSHNAWECADINPFICALGLALREAA